MQRNHPVVLVGPMASGKSAVGRMLAQRTGARFIDSDREIVERHGSISTIFEEQGEQAFRTLEASIVGEALGAGDAVVSLGGGAVLHPDTQALLAQATVVFLDTDVATVLPRISGDTGRPLLAERPAERWQELYDERRPLYAALATVVMDTRGRSVREVTDAVLSALGNAPGPSRDSVAAPSNDLNEESGTNPHGD
ncbi:shikimate kinase [Arthrobacter burdickii]|uniref:Shikimate kinase n=1 Tax=Arthrobacter burdickii TaxID=3035920 RepID=A0ABT8K1V7_9MICC|nr:shikimate kinase [Arthrobacter burdickii]MDN4611415.1 shikimate kinase [Arthrobacter burdickii]